VFANAAVFHGGPGESPTDETSYADYDDTMRTNARGVFATIAEAVPHLADDARVVVPSGGVAHESRSGMGAYAAVEGGAEAVARGFAADLSATVGVVDPGSSRPTSPGRSAPATRERRAAVRLGRHRGARRGPERRAARAPGVEGGDAVGGRSGVIYK